MANPTEIDIGAGVATLRMNRPDIHNALDDRMIVDLTEALERLGGDPVVRVVVLAGNGRSFSAGADIDWMRRMADNTVDENRAGARRLARLMRVLDTLPKPTVARVHGAAIGGGVGLAACCDLAIAAEDAVFALSEVRLGILPAVISPYVIRAVGPRQARHLFLTAERFGAAEALRIGLIHRAVPGAALDAAVGEAAAALLAGGPAAQAAAKQLVADMAGPPIDDALIEETARRIAEIRATPEGREGLSAFLEKRKPGWAPEG